MALARLMLCKSKAVRQLYPQLESMARTRGGFVRFAHPDPVRSLRPRQKCEALQSLFKEYYVVARIDAFLSLGMVGFAEPVFNHYRRQGHQFDTEVYNRLLFGWAAKKDRKRAWLLHNSMEKDEVARNPQTYAAMLVLCSHSKDWKAAKTIVREMKTNGYKLKHILYQTNLSKSQADEIMKVLQYFGVEPEVPPKKFPSYPRLVEPLYEDRKRRQERDEGQYAIRNLFDTEILEERMQEQLELELRGYETIPSVAASNKEKPDTVEAADELQEQWKQALQHIIQKDVENFHKAKRYATRMKKLPRDSKEFPYLALLPAEVWADITIEEAMNVLSQPEGIAVSSLCNKIGSAAWKKYVIMKKEEQGVLAKVQSMYKHYLDYLYSPNVSSLLPREVWEQLDRKNICEGSLSVDTPPWPLPVFISIGGALLKRLVDVATIPKDIRKPEGKSLPAFYHVIEIGSKNPIRVKGFVKPYPKTYQLFRKYYTKNDASYFQMNAAYLPMFVPPQPWTSITDGGYIVIPSSVMRCYNDTYQHHLLLEQADNLNAVLDSLNYLGSCPWGINTRVLDLLVGIFRKGGNEELGVHSLLSPFSDMQHSDNLSKQERREMKKIQNESYSLWMDMLYRLSLANHYRDKVFWLPNNMDFRGRVYPIPPHLSHLTSDVGRAILRFGVGYPLGEKGLDWLKIHLVNLHGEKKKASLSERLEFASEMMDEIMDSADRPFEGNRWWQTGDEQWQLLACCMEVTDAIRSGDPKKFVSYLPVQQDGSCNGLQHYAAMGSDLAGAKQVNLFPQDRPEDPYAGVAALVEERRKADAARDHEIAQILEGKIHRKVVKQTVMTVVYGVTFVGGREQVARQLDGTVPPEKLWKCSVYVAKIVFEVIRSMFTNARDIQDWLSQSARKVALAGKPMEWRTPLGLPVVQPYHKSKSRRKVTSDLQVVTWYNFTDFTHPPDPKKQSSAMPPNFVHSLDSTHMMLTALNCQMDGVPFAAVHDSFWTHACFVDQMNGICRKQFVSLHTQPILEELAEFWQHKFGGMEYRRGNKSQTCDFWEDFPTIGGNFDVSQVLQSVYFFS